MRDSKGFTLVEALVGMAILIVAVAGAMSFFIFGSQRATESFRYKNVEETLASVASLISYDIQRAGFGLFPGSGTAYPQLALFVVDSGGAGTTPDELYVNYSAYLNLDSNPQAPAADRAAPMCAATYRAINSVFTRPDKTFSCGAYTLYSQGFISLPTPTGFTLYAVPEASNTADLRAVLACSSGGTLGVVDATCAITATPPPQLPGTRNWAISFSSAGRNSTGGSQAIAANWMAVPAIAYKAVPGTATTSGSLLRNGVPIMGGDAYVDVNNFQVTCQFANGTWQTTNANPSTLRMVEINIRYRVNRGKGDQWNWSPYYSRTLRVTPRTIVLKQTVG